MRFSHAYVNQTHFMLCNAYSHKDGREARLEGGSVCTYQLIMALIQYYHGLRPVRHEAYELHDKKSDHKYTV